MTPAEIQSFIKECDADIDLVVLLTGTNKLAALEIVFRLVEKSLPRAINIIEDLQEKLGVATGALEHYSILADKDGALGRDRRTIAREALEKLK